MSSQNASPIHDQPKIEILLPRVYVPPPPRTGRLYRSMDVTDLHAAQRDNIANWAKSVSVPKTEEIQLSNSPGPSIVEKGQDSEDSAGVGYEALEWMKQVQERGRLESKSCTERQPPNPSVLKLEPSPMPKGKGDPAKKSIHKPTPLSISSSSALASALAAVTDTRTYTAEELAQVLSKIYAPGLIPSPVANALPTADKLSILSDPCTPTGYSAASRFKVGKAFGVTLIQKERNYICYFIDTLLAQLKEHEKGRARLLNDCEDKEVEKAGMQVNINHFYHQAQIKGKQIEQLKEGIRHLFSIAPTEKKYHAARFVKDLGIDIGEVIGAGIEEDKSLQDASERLKQIEKDATYWKERALAAEKYIGAWV